MEAKRQWAEGQLDLFVEKPAGERPRLRARPKDGLFPCGKCSKGYVFFAKGEYSYTAECECMGLSKLATRFDAMRLPPAAMAASIDDWKANGARPGADAIREWAGAFKPGIRGRIFMGANGVGKSWTAGALARLACLGGASVRWVKWSELLDDLRDCYAAQEPEHAVTMPLLSCDLLVVDDLGQEQKTEWSGVACERILGRRLEDGGTTLITTNAVSDEELREIVGARVFSRAVGACERIRMTGRDLRGVRP